MKALASASFVTRRLAASHSRSLSVRNANPPSNAISVISHPNSNGHTVGFPALQARVHSP